MGEVIKSTSSADKIEEHTRASLRTALALGGEPATLAQERLGPAVAALDATAAARRSAREAAATSWAAVLARHAKSGGAILMIRDTMWNLLGRPRSSAEMEQTFPGGVTLLTRATPHQEAMLMQVLQSRITTVPCARWTEDLRKEWVATLETSRAAYEAALAAHRPVAAAAMVADAVYRTAVRAAHQGLRAFKRDLRTAGYTDTQIHEIIPDASVPAGGATARKPPGAGREAGQRGGDRGRNTGCGNNTREQQRLGQRRGLNELTNGTGHS